MARLARGAVICAEGYLFELERRGYLQAGAFVPEVLFDHPEVVEQLHMDFVHAGSDVTQALTYYVHREKLRVIGREQDLVPMNRAALKIAKSVARRTGTLFAGDLCNTNIYDPGSKAALKEVERIFAEQVGWAVDAGVDYFVAETFSWGAEALLALEAIQKHSKVPAVVTMAMHREEITRDGLTPVEVCQRLEAAGAQVVGINCHRGPATIMPMMRQIRAAVSCHVAALPVPYRTTPAQPSFMSLTDPCCGNAARLPGRARSVRVHARGDLRLRARGLRARHPLPRGVLRGGPAPHPRPRREPGPASAGEPLHGRHVAARLLRHHRADPKIQTDYRGKL